jgi:hypothetical protein
VRAVTLAGQSVWVFFACRRFAAKTRADEGWILLDFLGFSRPNLDFSMGYTDLRRKKFFTRLVADVSAGRRPASLSARGRVVAHGLKLIVISDLPQAILVRLLPFGYFIQKHDIPNNTTGTATMTNA